MSHIHYLEIADHLGIQSGDVLMVSSDITNLFLEAIRHREKPDVNLFIDSLIEKVGSEGTLLFPTYNWGFCRGETFDYKRTKCLTGSLGSVALKRPDFVRTCHPIYSFAVWGKDQQLLYGMNNESSFGDDSPFGYLYRTGAKNLIIDVEDVHSFTFTHYVEQLSYDNPRSPVRVYRYIKPFTAGYVDEHGSCGTRTYSMLVRNLDLHVQNLPGVARMLQDHHAAEGLTLNGIPFIRIDLKASVPVILDDIFNNKSRKLCSYDGQN